MSASKKAMGHVYAMFTILVWGSCFVLTKELLKAYTAIQIIPLRMALAYVTLWVLRPKTLKLPRKDELMLILVGVTGGTLYFFLQNTALTYTYAANVSILVALAPILTVILAQLFSRSGERLGKFVYIGAVVALAGVVLVVLNGQMTFHLSPKGDLLALATAFMWAVYSILVKKYTEQYDNFIITRRVMLWGFLTSVPLMLLTDGMPDLHPLFTTPSILLSWLFLGVFGNAVCFAIWNIAFQRLGVVVTNNYLYASPFVTLAVGYLLLHEQITLMSVIGAVLITAGVVVALKKPPLLLYSYAEFIYVRRRFHAAIFPLPLGLAHRPAGVHRRTHLRVVGQRRCHRLRRHQLSLHRPRRRHGGGGFRVLPRHVPPGYIHRQLRHPRRAVMRRPPRPVPRRHR